MLFDVHRVLQQWEMSSKYLKRNLQISGADKIVSSVREFD